MGVAPRIFWKEPSFASFLTRLASFSRLILFGKRGTGLSDPVVDLVAGSGLAFVDRGTHSLAKGQKGWRVHAVVADVHS